jgi:hypothetical protein
MLRRVALVRTDDSEELSASIIKVTRIGELGRTLAVTSNRCTLPASVAGYSVIKHQVIKYNLVLDTFLASKFNLIRRSDSRFGRFITR